LQASKKTGVQNMIIAYQHEQQETGNGQLQSVMIDMDKKIIAIQRIKMVNNQIVGSVTVKYCL